MPDFPESGLGGGRLHPNPRKVAKLGPPKLDKMGPFWHISSMWIFGGPGRPPAYPHRGPIKRPSISYRTGPLGGPTSDQNAYILGQILVKDRSRSL